MAALDAASTRASARKAGRACPRLKAVIGRLVRVDASLGWGRRLALSHAAQLIVIALTSSSSPLRLTTETSERIVLLRNVSNRKRKRWLASSVCGTHRLLSFDSGCAGRPKKAANEQHDARLAAPHRRGARKRARAAPGRDHSHAIWPRAPSVLW